MATMNGASGEPWQPSVKYLLVLLIVEVFLFGALRVLTPHGG